MISGGLIDGYAVICRAFVAMIGRPLRNSSGENTSAPFGLTRFLARVLEEHDPDKVAVVFDSGRSFRGLKRWSSPRNRVRADSRLGAYSSGRT